MIMGSKLVGHPLSHSSAFLGIGVLFVFNEPQGKRIDTSK